jgi:hypothetical protein
MWPQAAHACSPPLCSPSAFVPGDEATVPASVGRLIWRPAAKNLGGQPPDLSHVRLVEDRDGGEAIPLDGEASGRLYELIPTEELVAGTRYRLIDEASCEADVDGDPLEVVFDVGPASPLPETLGTITVESEGLGEISFATFGGRCGVTVNADRVTINLEPSAEAAPWIEVLHFETLVNDERWAPRRLSTASVDPGASWIGRGRDRLYRACESVGGEEPIEQLAAGTHRVRFRATLPGTDLEIETPEVTVELGCPLDEYLDAGIGPQPGADAGSAGHGSSGGGCRAVASSAGGAYVVVIVAAAMAWRRRWWRCVNGNRP